MGRGMTQQTEVGAIRAVCVGGLDSWKRWRMSEHLQSTRALQLLRSTNMDFGSLSSEGSMNWTTISILNFLEGSGFGIRTLMNRTTMT